MKAIDAFERSGRRGIAFHGWPMPACARFVALWRSPSTAGANPDGILHSRGRAAHAGRLRTQPAYPALKTSEPKRFSPDAPA